MYRPIKSEVHALTHHLDGKKVFLADSSNSNGMYFSDMVVIMILLRVPLGQSLQIAVE